MWRCSWLSVLPLYLTRWCMWTAWCLTWWLGSCSSWSFATSSNQTQLLRRHWTFQTTQSRCSSSRFNYVLWLVPRTFYSGWRLTWWWSRVPSFMWNSLWWHYFWRWNSLWWHYFWRPFLFPPGLRSLWRWLQWFPRPRLCQADYNMNIMFNNIRPPKTIKDHMKCRWVMPNSKKSVPFCGSLGIHSEH